MEDRTTSLVNEDKNKGELNDVVVLNVALDATPPQSIFSVFHVKVRVNYDDVVLYQW